MTGIDDFFNSAADEVDSILGIVTMTVDGQSFDVVIDDVSKSTSGEDIGLTAQIDLVAVAQPADVTNPKLLINKKCVVDGSNYRINQVRVGTVAIHFMLTDPTK